MTNPFAELSQSMAAATAQAGNSLVRVEARRRLPASGLIWSADGLIITAHHVVQRDEQIGIGLPDGSTIHATLIGRDPTTDLALLQAEASGLTPLTEASLKEVAVGQLVLALGRPGRSVQATLGVISALGDGWRTHMGGQIDRYLQTDVVMYPGFSGGALINAHGQVIGLNSSALARGASLAVPAMTLARVVESLQTHGRVRRGYLGVSTQRVHLPNPLQKELGQKSGLLVVSVEEGSPAEAGGLTLGDTIVGVDSETVMNHDDLLALLTSTPVDTAVTVHIVRGGQKQKVVVTIGERP